MTQLIALQLVQQTHVQQLHRQLHLGPHHHHPQARHQQQQRHCLQQQDVLMLVHLTQQHQHQQWDLTPTTVVCRLGPCSVMRACGCARQTSKCHKQQQQQNPAPLLQQHATPAAPVSRHLHMPKGLTSIP